MNKYKYVGKNIPFKEADKKVAGRLKYVSDLNREDILHIKLLTADIPRGKIKNIDLSEAEKVAKVSKIYTHQNTPQKPFNGYNWYRGQNIKGDEVLLSSQARYVGDRIAAVVAEDKETAERAADLIEVEYKELEPILDPEKSIKEKSGLHGGENPFAEREYAYGDVDHVFKETPANLTFSDRVVTPKVHHAAMENHACLAYPEVDGERVTIISPCQLLFSVRLITSTVLKIPMNKVHVIKGNMGGSFGGKQETFLEPLAAFIAMDLKRPVKIFFNREESILSTRTRNKTIGRVKTVVSEEGTILARGIDMIVDTGAYTSNGDIVSAAMAKKISRLYKIPDQRYRSHSVHTNTPIGGACRGYGSPQIHTLTEINLDRVAHGLNMDRVELRRKNLLHPHEDDLLGGPNIGKARIIEALELGKKEFKWQEKNNKKKAEGRYRNGIGVACATHVNGYYDVYPDYSNLNLRFYEDGSLLLNSAIHDLGNSPQTIMAQIVGEVLEVEPEKITVLEGDTDRSPYDVGCHASRGTYVIGEAARRTAEKLKAMLLEETARLMQVEVEKVKLEGGKIKIDDKIYDYDQIISELQHKNQVELNVNNSYHSVANPASYGAHFCQLEVDTLTGLVEIKDYVAVHDVGRAINPLAVKTQIDGGVQMGIGMALLEDIEFDEQGYPQATNFADYHLVNAPQMPKVRSFLIEDNEEYGPYGAKSIGEIATVPVAAAVVNAVNDALGLYLTNLPLTPARITVAFHEKSEK